MEVDMEIEKRHGAIIQVDFKILLKILDFEGGTIHRVFTPDDFMNPSYFCVVLEHNDLPAVPVTELLPKIKPIMQLHYAVDGGIIKVERIDPPKKG